MLATTTVYAPPTSSVKGVDAGAPPSSAGVLRVSREIENIGERVPMSKKRITWRFVFEDSEQVHTVMLEHSRMTAKKRLRLDGRRLFTSEQYCPGDWRYEFHVAKTHSARFCVTIKDVKSTVVEERSLDSIYQLTVNGQGWHQLLERQLPTVSAAVRQRGGGSVWSSEMYARRVSLEERVMERTGDDDHNNKPVTAQCVAWTFAFGLHGTIHKLELRDVDRDGDGGEFVVILDSRLLTRVDHDDIEEDSWEYDYTLFEQHTLSVLVTLHDDGGKKYEFFIDGCAWKDLSETDFVLQPGWFPVYSRSRGTSYFRNETNGSAQWERPIMSRDGVTIDVPRRMSKNSVPLPADRFDEDGVMRMSQPGANNIPAPEPVALAPIPKEEPTVNLLDFSEMAVHVSPTAQMQDSFASFDPFAQLAVQQQQQQNAARRAQQPVDLLS